jgi:hypothetical protein
MTEDGPRIQISCRIFRYVFVNISSNPPTIVSSICIVSAKLLIQRTVLHLRKRGKSLGHPEPLWRELIDVTIATELQSGFLRELKHSLDNQIVSYSLTLNDITISLNECLGKQVTIAATGKKSCIHCGRKVHKLYSSGYCYPCFSTLAECDLCIVKPHECHFHLGTCRDESFAESHCMIPHYVYLAISSTVKVGLTRKGRQLTRWVDQGATRAILLAELPTRKEAGELEMEIAAYMPDKTDWRKMLAAGAIDESVDLVVTKHQVSDRISEARKRFVLTEDANVHEFHYPRLAQADLVLKSLSLDKIETISGVLLGIKGQYLLLDCGVLNIKKHSGYEVQVSMG